MHWIVLAFQNIRYRPLNSLLSVLLFALSIGLIVFLTELNGQLKQKFENNLAGIDLIIGAKGSPLQMVLCNMYHVDVPTGNIPLKSARPFLNPNHPLIEGAWPLSLGDSYKGYRVVGTDASFLDLYNGQVEKGSIWTKSMDVILGATVAERLEIAVGDQFQSVHGLLDDDDMMHDDAPAFTVTGILSQNGSVLDQLILTPSESVWHVHEDHEHAHDHDQADSSQIFVETDHSSHSHAEDKPEGLLDLYTSEPEGKEITSLLLRFKGRSYQSLNMARNINENTDLMAASPAIEMNRLYSMMGVGVNAMEKLVYVIGFVALLSIFISLYQAIRTRRYELAVLRAQGASGLGLFVSICLEGLLLALIGGVTGILIGRSALSLMAESLEQTYRYAFKAWDWSSNDVYFILIGLLLAVLAAAFPAISAFRMNVHKVLSES
jgi:putative ABC transport system permease protein